jgi:acetoacetyl-CoA reductase/3-oxoacyl-[acyl-carrier protein] reductase
MSEYLKGKIAVVTGAANGIGRATAIRLAQEGADVALLDRETDPLKEVESEIAALGRRVLPCALDLTDRRLIVATFEDVRNKLGPVDVLVNNVGGTARTRASEFYKSEPEIWDHVVNLSLMIGIMCTRQVVPAMRDRKSGKIVSIASDTAFVGDNSMAEYAAAKAGVIGFTRGLARELAPFNVNVNAVAPGPTRTRALSWQGEDRLQKMTAGIPLGRLAEPMEIANVVNFLATSQASFVTGQVIAVNGGRIFH